MFQQPSRLRRWTRVGAERFAFGCIERIRNHISSEPHKATGADKSPLGRSWSARQRAILARQRTRFTVGRLTLRGVERGYRCAAWRARVCCWLLGVTIAVDRPCDASSGFRRRGCPCLAAVLAVFDFDYLAVGVAVVRSLAVGSVDVPAAPDKHANLKAKCFDNQAGSAVGADGVERIGVPRHHPLDLIAAHLVAVVLAAGRIVAAAPLPGADFPVTQDGLAVLERDLRHADVAVAQVAMLYHSRHGPVVLCPSN